jgi:hypothetical protein
MAMDSKRGALVVGASVAALTAGWYIYRWYQKREHEEQLESEELVRQVDEQLERMNDTKKPKRTTNGRHTTAKA